MTALTEALMFAYENGTVDRVVREAVRTAADEQANATPSRGQIAAMVLAGIVSHETGYAESYAAAVGQAVKYADALLAELVKTGEAAQ